jgi:hypothetical protein
MGLAKATLLGLEPLAIAIRGDVGKHPRRKTDAAGSSPAACQGCVVRLNGPSTTPALVFVLLPSDLLPLPNALT